MANINIKTDVPTNDIYICVCVFVCVWCGGGCMCVCVFVCVFHRHLSNIDCLKARTTCLVCFISTVNGHRKKEKVALKDQR